MFPLIIYFRLQFQATVRHQPPSIIRHKINVGRGVYRSTDSANVPWTILGEIYFLLNCM